MCGIVGMAGTLVHDHKAVLSDLLYLDTLRGKDSTGVLAVKRSRSYSVIKKTIPGYEFIEEQSYKNMLNVNDQVWLGHNRFKTVGNASRANAHPFEVTNDEGFTTLVGVHNGTLKNKFQIERDLPESYGTDSEALFNFIDKAGDDLKAEMAKVEGAWSLVWWDAPSNQLKFLRNKERPMFIAYTKDKKAIMFASSYNMLKFAAEYNGTALAHDKNGVAIFSTEVDCLYTLDIPQNAGEELPKLKKEGGYSGKAPSTNFHSPATSYIGALYSQSSKRDNEEFWDALGDEEEAPASGATQPLKKAEKKASQNGGTEGTVLQASERFKSRVVTAPNLASLTPKEIKAVRDAGCIWCGDRITTPGVTLLSENEGICDHCVNDTHCVKDEQQDKRVG